MKAKSRLGHVRRIGVRERRGAAGGFTVAVAAAMFLGAAIICSFLVLIFGAAAF